MVKIILAALVVLWVRTCTSNGEPDEPDYLWDERHWQGMTWFNTFNTHKGLVDKRKLSVSYTDFGRVTRLKIIPVLMVCGYGQKLTDFLWLTIYTVKECRNMSENMDNYDDDCWEHLGGSLKKGALTVFKLLRTFKQIISLDSRLNIDDIPFYDTLLAVHGFLEKQGPSVKNTLTETEATSFNQQVEHFAKSFGELLDGNCNMEHSVVNQEKLIDEYKDQKNNKFNVLHDFYLNRLDFSAAYMRGHMLHLGFKYVPETDKVIFSIPK